MTRIEKLLSSVFYRLSCPKPETLGDYHLGQLPAGEQLVVARHLRDCPHCARELETYAAATDAEAENILERLPGLVRRVLWATPAADVPSAVALRGDIHAQRVYQAGDVQLVLEIQPATSGYRRQHLLAKIEAGETPRTYTEVELWREAELLESCVVDDEGSFSFDRLKPGAYTLCLRGHGTEVWVETDVPP